MPIWYLMNLTFCIGFCMMCSFVENGIKLINYVGRNTVGIMVLHKYLILFLWVCSSLQKDISRCTPFVVSLFVAVILICLCFVASEIIYRVCPIVMGRRKE